MLVYGLDDEQQPRAAIFQQSDFKLAKKGAELLRLKSIIGKAEQLMPALKGIKEGKAQATQSGFAPAIEQARLDELVAALKSPPSPTHATAPKLPATWASIKAGHVVMAQADDKADGWWPVVVEAVEGDILVLRSIDFPEITVKRHRSAVALGYTPGYEPPEGLAEVTPGLPKDWSSLTSGHLVIALESRTEGSYEALVTKVEGKTLSLRWRDSPRQADFTRTLDQIALLNPKLPEPPASNHSGPSRSRQRST